MSDRQEPLNNRVVILNGFTDHEIIAVMNVVKAIYANADMDAFVRFVEAAAEHPAATDFSRRLLRVVAAAKQTPESAQVGTGDLIFAKTTETSLRTTLAEVIEDMSQDHAYLRENPPQRGSTADSPNQPDGGSR